MTAPAWLQRLNQPKQTKAKITKKEKKAMRWYQPTPEDLEHDCREMVTITVDILVGALIEPDRMKDQWCRARIRELLLPGGVKRLTTLNYLRNAQRQPNAFFFLIGSWREFQYAEDLLDSDRKQGMNITEINWNEPTISNIEPG